MQRAQLQRRFPAERAHLRKRLPHDYGYDDVVNFGVSFTLTAPTTITVLNLPTSRSGAASNIISEYTEETTSLSTTPTSLSSMKTATLVAVPTLYSATVSPSTPGDATPSDPAGDDNQNGNNTLPVPNANSALGSRTLPTGAIVGTVIAVFLLSLAVIVFLVRKRFVQNRQKRSFNWKVGFFKKRLTTNVPANTHSSFEAAGNIRRSTAGDGNTSPGYRFARAQAEALENQSSNPAPPPMSYNSNNPALVSTPGPSAPRAAGTASRPLPPNGATVKCTFIPTLPDELSISTGEVVRVLAEFDDGWGLCVNGRGEQGMVPLECLDRGGSGSQEQGEGREFRNSRRASSLAASSRRY